MSRSYKHTPIWTDGNPKSLRAAKNFANSKVRNCRDENIPTHNRAWFKKVFESYNIHDYITYESKCNAIFRLTQQWKEEEEDQVSKQQPIEQGYYHKQYCTLNNFIQNHWQKFFKRK